MFHYNSSLLNSEISKLRRDRYIFSHSNTKFLKGGRFQSHSGSSQIKMRICPESANVLAFGDEGFEGLLKSYYFENFSEVESIKH